MVSAGSVSVELVADTSPFQQALAAAIAKLKSVPVAAQAAADKLAGLSTAIKEAEEHFERFSAVKEWADHAALAGAAVAGSMIAAGTAAVIAASKFEQSGALIERIFKGNAVDVDLFAQALSKNTGVAMQDVQGAVSQLGTQLNQSLGDTTAAREQSQSLVAMAVDMATIMHMPFAEVIDHLQSAIRGVVRSGEQLNIILSESALQQEAAAMGMSKSVQTMTVQEKTMVQLSAIHRQTANIQGASAQQAGTLLGQWQRLDGGAKNLATTIGQTLEPAALKLISAARGVVDWFQSMGSTGTTMIVAFMGVVAVVGLLVAGAGLLVTAFIGLNVAAYSLSAAAVVVSGALARFAGEAGILAIGLSPAAAGAVGLALVLGKLALVAGAFVGAFKLTGAVIDAFGGKSAGLVEGFGAVLDVITGFTGTMDALKKSFAILTDAFLDFLKPFTGKVGGWESFMNSLSQDATVVDRLVDEFVRLDNVKLDKLADEITHLGKAMIDLDNPANQAFADEIGAPTTTGRIQATKTSPEGLSANEFAKKQEEEAKRIKEAIQSFENVKGHATEMGQLGHAGGGVSSLASGFEETAKRIREIKNEADKLNEMQATKTEQHLVSPEAVSVMQQQERAGRIAQATAEVERLPFREFATGLKFATEQIRQMSGPKAAEEFQRSVIAPKDVTGERLQGLTRQVEIGNLPENLQGFARALEQARAQTQDTYDTTLKETRDAFSATAASTKQAAASAVDLRAALAGTVHDTDDLAAAAALASKGLQDMHVSPEDASKNISSAMKGVKFNSLDQVLAGKVGQALDGLDLSLDPSQRKDVVKGLSTSLADLFQGGGVNAGALGGAIGEAAAPTGLASALIPGAAEGATAAGGAVVGGSAGAIAGPVGAAAGVAVGALLSQVIPMIGDAFKSVATNVVDVAKSIPDAIKGLIGALGQATGQGRLSSAMNVGVDSAMLFAGALIAALAATLMLVPAVVVGAAALLIFTPVLGAATVLLGLLAASLAALVVGVTGVMTIFDVVFAPWIVGAGLMLAQFAFGVGALLSPLAALAIVLAGGIGVIGTFLALSTDTKSFKRFQDAFGAVVDRVVKAMEPFWTNMIFLAGLFAMLVNVTTPLMSNLLGTNAGAQLLFEGFKLVAEVIGVVAIAFALLESAILADVINQTRGYQMLVSGLAGLLTAMDQVELMLVQGLEGFLKGITPGGNLSDPLQKMFDTVTGKINDRISSVQDPAAAVEAALQKVIDGAQALSPNIKSMVDAFVALTQSTYATTTGMGLALASEYQFTHGLDDMSESLTNVPDGFKVALERFTAIQPGVGAAPGFNWDTGAGGGNQNFFIQSMSVESTNPQDLAQQVQDIAERKAMQQQGTTQTSDGQNKGMS